MTMDKKVEIDKYAEHFVKSVQNQRLESRQRNLV